MFRYRYFSRTIVVLLACLLCALTAAGISPIDRPARDKGPIPPIKEGGPDAAPALKGPARTLTAVIRGTIDIAPDAAGGPAGDLTLRGRVVMPSVVEVTVYQVVRDGPMFAEEVPFESVAAPLRSGRAAFSVEVPALTELVLSARFIGRWEGLPSTREVRVEPVNGDVYFLTLLPGAEAVYDFRIETPERRVR
jgi:hypothetical protein